MPVHSFNNIEGLYVSIVRDLGANVKTIFSTCAQNLEMFIWDKSGQIDNNAGAEAGFYTNEHYEETLEKLKNRTKPGDDPAKVNQPKDEDYALGDPIISNFVEFKDPKTIYDKIEKRKIFPEISFVLKNTNADPDKVPGGKPQEADYKWTLTEEVLTDESISKVVRAALVYEREDFGHTPWKKLHQACEDPRFIAELLGAPVDQVNRSEVSH